MSNEASSTPREQHKYMLVGDQVQQSSLPISFPFCQGWGKTSCKFLLANNPAKGNLPLSILAELKPLCAASGCAAQNGLCLLATMTLPMEAKPPDKRELLLCNYTSSHALYNPTHLHC